VRRPEAASPMTQKLFKVYLSSLTPPCCREKGRCAVPKTGWLQVCPPPGGSAAVRLRVVRGPLGPPSLQPWPRRARLQSQPGPKSHREPLRCGDVTVRRPHPDNGVYHPLVLQDPRPEKAKNVCGRKETRTLVVSES
jgi:hypothetical protein